MHTYRRDLKPALRIHEQTTSSDKNAAINGNRWTKHKQLTFAEGLKAAGTTTTTACSILAARVAKKSE